MPEMNGYEFRQAQLSDPELSAIPVFVVSAGSYAKEADARRIGLETFFRKPMEVDALMAAVRQQCQWGE